MVGGGLLFVVSICSALSYLLTPIMTPERGLISNASVLSVGAAAAVYGACLFWIGRAWRRGAPDRAFQLPSPLIFLGIYIGALVFGQAILSLGIGAAYLFPPLHVIASLVVALAVLSFAARRLKPVTLRTMLAQFTWGGLVTIVLALVFEILIGGALIVLALVAVALLLGTERTTELVTALQTSAGNIESLLAILAAEPLVMAIAALTAVVLLVFVVPILEEIIKSAGPAWLISRRARAFSGPSRNQVVMWGLAAGAGYAFTENMFNAQASISAGQEVFSLWATAMLLRSGTVLMHMVATATVAVGWYYGLVERNWTRMALLFGLSTLAHATWNTGALVLGGVAATAGLDENLAVLAGFIIGLAFVLLGGLFIGFVFWLRRLIRWGQPPPVEIITSSGTLLEIKG